jgi:hypothetical protein
MLLKLLIQLLNHGELNIERIAESKVRHSNLDEVIVSGPSDQESQEIYGNAQDPSAITSQLLLDPSSPLNTELLDGPEQLSELSRFAGTGELPKDANDSIVSPHGDQSPSYPAGDSAFEDAETRGREPIGESPTYPLGDTEHSTLMAPDLPPAQLSEEPAHNTSYSEDNLVPTIGGSASEIPWRPTFLLHKFAGGLKSNSKLLRRVAIGVGVGALTVAASNSVQLDLSNINFRFSSKKHVEKSSRTPKLNEKLSFFGLRNWKFF